MNPELREVWKQMLNLGIGSLSHALLHSSCSAMQNRYWPELSVLQAAHAAELIVKARIAQEHPLLIFEKLPKASASNRDLLDFKRLFESARTIQFDELPDRLWAATGTTLPDLELFKAFGRLRNSIQHFAAPDDEDLQFETLQFIFRVLDPFLYEHWKMYAVDFNEDHEPHIYLMQALVRHGILFNVSPDALKSKQYCHFEFDDTPVGYKSEILARFENAEVPR